MANDNLNTAQGLARTPEVYALATEVQVQASRIESLADAIDESICFGSENEEERRRLGRAYDYLMLISEAAKKAAAAGERLEEIGFFNKPKAAVR